ncbi:MAG: discoidin domain-containing protein [Acidimicrobiia bacterium]|nr:discoidin domain-containing protein [Acidimicrobiia bacterium]
MDEQLTDAPPEVSRGLPGWALLAIAVAVIAVPVIVGVILINTGDSSSPVVDAGGASEAGGMGGASDGMGGGMGGSDDAGGDSTSPVAIVERPAGVLAFSEIQAGDMVLEASGDGMMLLVTTTIDVACAVAYGPTEGLGAIATDTDMAGGGHTDHSPVMRGLESGVDYFYMVQGIGPDGTLYQSDLMRFTASADIVVAPAVDPPAPNIAALARVRDASSEYSDAFGASNAIDGDLATEWSSAGDGDDAYIVLEFDNRVIVEGVGFRTREMSDGTSLTTSFTITVDGGETYGPFDAGPGLAVALVDFAGYRIRIDVATSTGGNTGAIEVEIYGEEEM